MNKLANNGHKKARAGKELAIGAGEDIIEEVIESTFEYFSQRGLKVILIDENDRLEEDCDMVIYTISWDQASVYLSAFNGEEYSPDVFIAINNCPDERGSWGVTVDEVLKALDL